ncbi:MAG: protein phosphatase CheZ [Pseudomonadota bacterium]|nr:protein phosphatase CheZ [Pseudomonadota bacterium]
MSQTAERDNPDLEALFDSVVEARQSSAAAAPAVAAAVATLVPPAMTLAVGREASGVESTHDGHSELIQRIGHLTRSLHDSLRELGYDKKIEQAAAAIPDTRDRLAYVANLTGDAADKVLTLTERTLPLQEAIGAEARTLSRQWQALFDKRLSVEDFRELVGQTRDYLEAVPRQTAEAHRNLRDIMLAQDFHDLTGQVIRKITEMAQRVETELVGLLVESVSPATRAEYAAPSGLINGPVINAEGRSDVVANQAQVDDLLASLGF